MVVLLISLVLLAIIFAIEYSSSKRYLNDSNKISDRVFVAILIVIGVFIFVIMCSLLGF